MAYRSFSRGVVIALSALVLPLVVCAQAPYPVQPGVPPAAPAPQPTQIPQQQPTEYAFRPDLTNPQYGECLGLEKQWQTLWQNYYQLYYQHRMMNPNDPAYSQLTYHVRTLKQQLDNAWQQFSSQCIYFPTRR